VSSVSRRLCGCSQRTVVEQPKRLNRIISQARRTNQILSTELRLLYGVRSTRSPIPQMESKPVSE
jgi:hypothetical protein